MLLGCVIQEVYECLVLNVSVKCCMCNFQLDEYLLSGDNFHFVGNPFNYVKGEFSTNVYCRVQALNSYHCQHLMH